MNYLTEALAWIADPANQSGPNGIVTRLAEHLLYTMIATGGAALVAIPLGCAIGHTGRGRDLVVVGHRRRPGPARPGGAHTDRAPGRCGGRGAADRTRRAGCPVHPGRRLLRHRGGQAGRGGRCPSHRNERMAGAPAGRIPLGLPQLLGGLRSAALQVVATAALVAYVGGGGLGRFLFLGLDEDYPQMLAASLLVVALAVIFEVLFEVVTRAGFRHGALPGSHVGI